MNFWQDKTQEYCYKMVQVYKEQLQDFVTAVPQFKIANAVIHFDETSSPSSYNWHSNKRTDTKME